MKNQKWLRNKLLIQEVLRGQRPLLIYGVVTQRANPNAQNYAERGLAEGNPSFICNETGDFAERGQQELYNIVQRNF